ncbi:hypothetical protein WJX81_003018 [Elliptochloris bilobata]|uniref:carbonic anhydrase n=1 Tax=Elliptochloris bilobata TaxID=381761 RepID=A0AAW1RDQ9_9CHLO
MLYLLPALLGALTLFTGCNAFELATATGNEVCKQYNASHVAFDYAFRGTDWVTNPKGAWKCGGSHQSPVDYMTSDYQYVPVNCSASVQLGAPNVSSAGVLNLPQWQIEVLGSFKGNGLAVPVCNGTDVGCLNSPGVQPKYVYATIANYHFHTPSEHTLDGEYLALESHLVTLVSQKDVPACPAAGCLVVWGAWYRISNSQTNNTFLDQIEPYINGSGAGCTALPTDKTINLVDAFPRDRTYVTYSGSLTTPPCTEGVLWVSFQSPLQVSSQQLLAISNAMNNVRDCLHTPQGAACASTGFQADSRMLQDLNGRQLHKFSPPSGYQPS